MGIILKKLGLIAVAAFSLAAVTSGSVKAAPITVTDTVTGGPGAWVYEFSVTNNLGGSNDIYFFGVELSTTNVTGSPSGWSFAPTDTPWSNSAYGGSSTLYNNTWCCTFGGIAPGQTLSGFEVTDTAATAVGQVAWFAFAYGDVYSGSGSFYSASNPGFEGYSNDTTAVPEPASLVLLSAGLFGLGVIRRRCA